MMKFIHIGMHRCGSTFLQTKLFPSIKELSLISFNEDNPISEEINRLILCADLYYDREDATNKIQKKLADHSFNCISSEGLSGMNDHYFGGYHVQHVAERLKYIFGETKILIVIRNQKTCLPSTYHGEVRMGYLSSYKRWLLSRYKTFELNFLKYSRIIKCYQDIFGPENVSVSLYEEIFNKTEINRLLEELGVNSNGVDNADFNMKVNSSFSRPTIAMTKIMNRFFGSKLTHNVNVGKDSRLTMYNCWRYTCASKLDQFSAKLGIKSKSYSFDEYDDLLYELYHEDNLMTSKLIGRDLSKNGYI
jgi:hypothetical protein